MSELTVPGGCVLNAWHGHHAELGRYLLHRAAGTAAAEDLLQEVFVKAMRAGGDFCRLDNPRAWLFQVARNALADHFRLQKPSVPVSQDLPQEQFDVPYIDQLTGCMERVLSELSEADREIIAQCDLAGTKLAAYAEAHALSLPAVKSRLQRARLRMRKRMIAECQIRFDEAGQVCCHDPRC
jgi:RNA polymerase sigma-70 factor (ECF subfamily)